MPKYLLIIGMLSLGLQLLHAKPGDTIAINNDIQLIHLGDSVFMHVTCDTIGSFGRTASNGMLFIKNNKAVMVDTPVSNRNTEGITKFIKEKWGVTLDLLIIGHHHIDCMGGIDYIHSQGIKSIANSRTIEKCKALNLPIPIASFEDSLVFNFNGLQVVCRYFGAGHAIDNITVWLPEYHILFGGCLIKSSDATRLGNLTDAIVADWDITVSNIIAKYKDIKIIIPGHGNYGGPELLTHTIDLVKSHRNKN